MLPTLERAFLAHLAETEKGDGDDQLSVEGKSVALVTLRAHLLLAITTTSAAKRWNETAKATHILLVDSSAIRTQQQSSVSS
jgi:hypothetical protein